MRIGTRGSALALAQARHVADLLGGAEVVTSRSTPHHRTAVTTAVGAPCPRQVPLGRRAGGGAAGGRNRPGGALRQGRAGRAGRRPGPGRRPGARGRADALCGAACWRRCPRAPASGPAACAAPPSCARARRPEVVEPCAATSTPACASSAKASATRSCSRERACSAWAARRRGGRDPTTRFVPAPRPGHAGAGGARRRRDDARSRGGDHRQGHLRVPAGRARRDARPGCLLPHAAGRLGAARRLRLLELRAWVGLPDGSAWVSDGAAGGFCDAAELGRRVGERMGAAGADDLLKERGGDGG